MRPHRGWCLIYKVPVRPVPNPQLFVPLGIKNSLGTLEWYLNIKTCTSLSKFCTKYCGKQLHFIALLAFAGGYLAWTESPPCGSDNFLPMSKAHLANKLDLYSWRQWSFCLWKTWEGADRWGELDLYRWLTQSIPSKYLVHPAPWLNALQAWTLPWVLLLVHQQRLDQTPRCMRLTPMVSQSMLFKLRHLVLMSWKLTWFLSYGDWHPKISTSWPATPPCPLP